MTKIGLFSLVFLLAAGFLSNSLAQEYTQWHLPEGATVTPRKRKDKGCQNSHPMALAWR